MKQAIKKFLQDYHLFPLVKAIIDLGKLLKYQVHRRFGAVDRQILTNYLQQNQIRKLHIGCGFNMIDGWLNSDYQPYPTDTLRLDATKTFPIEDNQFDYIFSEHMIEHLEYVGGSSMLRESFRVLRKDGTMRVSTPDMPFLIDLYQQDKSVQQLEYIKWATDNFVPDTDYDDVFVINNFVRAWGHTFIYDEKTLRSSMEKAGFMNIVRCDLNQSVKASFRDLENETRLPPGFLRMETLTLEGTKLADS
jgi:predicted SAM-dependent methyltransferase